MEHMPTVRQFKNWHRRRVRKITETNRAALLSTYDDWNVWTHDGFEVLCRHEGPSYEALLHKTLIDLACKAWLRSEDNLILTHPNRHFRVWLFRLECPLDFLILLAAIHAPRSRTQTLRGGRCLAQSVAPLPYGNQA